MAMASVATIPWFLAIKATKAKRERQREWMYAGLMMFTTL